MKNKKQELVSHFHYDCEIAIKTVIIFKIWVIVASISNFTWSLVVCSREIDRFLSEGARDGVRVAGETDRVSRGSVDIALFTKRVKLKRKFTIIYCF